MKSADTRIKFLFAIFTFSPTLASGAARPHPASTPKAQVTSDNLQVSGETVRIDFSTSMHWTYYDQARSACIPQVVAAPESVEIHLQPSSGTDPFTGELEIPFRFENKWDSRTMSGHYVIAVTHKASGEIWGIFNAFDDTGRAIGQFSDLLGISPHSARIGRYSMHNRGANQFPLGPSVPQCPRQDQFLTIDWEEWRPLPLDQDGPRLVSVQAGTHPRGAPEGDSQYIVWIDQPQGSAAPYNRIAMKEIDDIGTPSLAEAIAETGRGAQFALGDEGVYYYDPDSKEIFHFKFSDKSKTVLHAPTDNPHSLWFEDSRLFWEDRDSLHILDLQTSSESSWALQNPEIVAVVNETTFLKNETPNGISIRSFLRWGGGEFVSDAKYVPGFLIEYRPTSGRDFYWIPNPKSPTRGRSVESVQWDVSNNVILAKGFTFVSNLVKLRDHLFVASEDTLFKLHARTGELTELVSGWTSGIEKISVVGDDIYWTNGGPDGGIYGWVTP